MSTATLPGKQLKLRGMGLAAAKHEDALKAAQWLAQLIGSQKPSVSINDVRRYISGLNNASGSVFSGPEWEAVGWEPAIHEEGHSRYVRVWRLKR
jgi:hypothetical protein